MFIGDEYDDVPTHKRKGAPKQISAEEMDMLNNSPSGLNDSMDNEENISDTDTGQGTPHGYQPEGDYVDQSDHRTRKKPDDCEEDDEDEIVYVEPDLAIKQEKVKGEAQNSCMFDSSPSVFTDSPQTVSRPPPPLRQRPDPTDPRNSHPSGLDSDQLALSYSTPIKQEMNQELVQMPQSKVHDQSPVPVSMVSSAGSTQPLDGLGDMQAFPVDWGNQSGQEFLPMSGDDSSQQASGSGGASQQVGVNLLHYSCCLFYIWVNSFKNTVRMMKQNSFFGQMLF